MSENLERDLTRKEASQESREIKPNSKVGLSLSFCVNDILRGKIREEEVKEIIAATNASTPEKIDEVIGAYKRIYWYKNPEEGEAIARRLFAAGKVRQPRTEGGKEHNIAAGHWLDADKIGEEYEKRVME